MSGLLVQGQSCGTGGMEHGTAEGRGLIDWRNIYNKILAGGQSKAHQTQT